MKHHHNWRGGRSRTQHGYILLRMPSHPRAMRHGCVYEHILVAERALGHALPTKACVHHVNEVRTDNRRCNLVICEDVGYHKLLHRRTEAYAETGSVRAVRCIKCKQWGFNNVGDMHTVNRSDRVDGGHSYHRSCLRKNAEWPIVRTQCSNGHDFTPDNTKIVKNCKQCRICLRAKARRLYKQNKGDKPIGNYTRRLP